MNEPLVFILDRQQWKPPDSKALRLIKRVFADPLPAGTRLQLFGGARRPLDEEVIHPDHQFPLTIGFWIRWPQKTLRLRITQPGGGVTVHGVRVAGRAAPAVPLTPMADLAGYLQRREAAADVWPGVRRLDVARYLRRHGIVYEKPATHWTEGLYLGNGRVGGVVTGALDGRFHLGLDDCRIWPTDAAGRPLGRGYAADLTLRYPGAGAFRQVLDIGQAVVRTSHGPLSIDCWIDRATSLAFVELRAGRAMTVTATLTRRPLPLVASGLPAVTNGSWSRILPPEKLAEFRRQVDEAPQAPIELSAGAGVASLTCRAPNMAITTTLTATATPVTAAGEIRLTLRLKRNQPQRLVLAVDVRPTPQAPAAKMLRSALKAKRPFERHRAAWAELWSRSFLQLASPLQESLYYHGLYHTLATFAGNHSPSFFGMTQPIDHRTWLDGHTTDAQTAMLQWGTLATNHLASGSALLQQYAEAWVEHAEHTPSSGAKVPHMFYPLSGGGHATLAPPAKLPYPFGSTAWHALDFWWDWLYSHDRRFLRNIAYPILRSAADAIVATMTLRDGVYHCEGSNSPEQEGAHRDNVYDRTTVQALLAAVIEASQRLSVDAGERRRFRRVLDRLFQLPSDGQTILESADNTHPYRCHPVVLMGLYPLMQWRPGSREWQLAQKTFDVVNNVYGFHFEDRHRTIVGHAGGIEPNGHATAFLLGFAARLRRPADFDRLFDCLVVGRQLKRNGLRSICDPRHSPELERMAIIEASSGQSAAISETVLQSWPSSFSPSPGIPGEGGVRVLSQRERHSPLQQNPLPNPPPEYRERGPSIDVFPCAVAGRPQRFAGLRAAGGFVVSGEWTGQRVRFVAVHSLVGGRLELTAPWDGPVLVTGGRRARFPLRTRPGQTILFATRAEDFHGHAWTFDDIEPAGPIAIPVSATDPHTPDVLYYPEDLPHGQAAEAGHLFLGNPAKLPPAAPLPWDERQASRRSTSADPRERQTAARVLGRRGTTASRRALARLAGDDDVLVAATAVVSLVRHGQAASDRLLARVTPGLPAYLQREAQKSLARRAVMCNVH